MRGNDISSGRLSKVVEKERSDFGAVSGEAGQVDDMARAADSSAYTRLPCH